MALFLFFSRRDLGRKWPACVVGIVVARLAFLGERAYAFLAILGASDFQHGFQLLLITLVGAVPIPIHFHQPLGMTHGEIRIRRDLTGETEPRVEKFAMADYLID